MNSRRGHFFPHNLQNWLVEWARCQNLVLPVVPFLTGLFSVTQNAQNFETPLEGDFLYLISIKFHSSVLGIFQGYTTVTTRNMKYKASHEVHYAYSIFRSSQKLIMQSILRFDSLILPRPRIHSFTCIVSNKWKLCSKLLRSTFQLLISRRYFYSRYEKVGSDRSERRKAAQYELRALHDCVRCLGDACVSCKGDVDCNCCRPHIAVFETLTNWKWGCECFESASQFRTFNSILIT